MSRTVGAQDWTSEVDAEVEDELRDGAKTFGPDGELARQTRSVEGLWGLFLG